MFRRWVKTFYAWGMESLNSRWGVGVFALISFMNSIILPLSPYFMLVPMCLSRPKRWFAYATVATVASIAGGYVMWAAGFYCWEGFSAGVARWMPWLALHDIGRLATEYRGATFAGVIAATASPLPYKAVALACGLGHVPLLDFTLASFLGRGIRLYVTAGVLAYGGPAARRWIVQLFGRSKSGGEEELKP